MRWIKGNLWDFHEQNKPVAITTNGVINTHNMNVMGKGVALEAKNLFPNLPRDVAKHISNNGNVVGFFPNYKLFTFPTKDYWWEKSSLQLIEDSAIALSALVTQLKFTEVYMPCPGIGNGKLTKSQVEPLISIHLDHRFVVVEKY
jgi:hypothetical protein